MLGLEATAGFGVRYDGLHGTDERIAVATILSAHSVYCEAVLRLTQALDGQLPGVP
jgi:succinyl-diaminopimelate desuccinylase